MESNNFQRLMRRYLREGEDMGGRGWMLGSLGEQEERGSANSSRRVARNFVWKLDIGHRSLGAIVLQFGTAWRCLVKHSMGGAGVGMGGESKARIA